ncbi:hypothetical protein HAX54_012227 [Datura stramonium]|uniref:Uncharacterized protein n=1 Tax=Datura stramonium TaxID=4076 RepID=A0ABS8TJE3_DATST|nr:hypothetical protein [Datura stramonium]
MEANSSNSTKTASSLRWRILKRAILGGPSSNSDYQSEVGIKGISREATRSFNLIPCHLMKDFPEAILGSLSEENQLHGSQNAVFCYTLNVDNAPRLLLQLMLLLYYSLVRLLCQRMDNLADLSDFEVCNNYDIDNTGLFCQWPSEEVLAYYCLSHADMFRKQVGLPNRRLKVEPFSVIRGDIFITFRYTANINANSGGFGSTEVKPLMLHWGQDKETNISNKFDIIIASDWSFCYGSLLSFIGQNYVVNIHSAGKGFGWWHGNVLEKLK